MKIKAIKIDFCLISLIVGGSAMKKHHRSRAEIVSKRRGISYLKVSTENQDLKKFKADVLMFAHAKNLAKAEFMEEQVSGMKSWRKRKLGEIMSSLKKGDTIITPELSRLGRSTLEILEIIKEAREKGIAVYAVKGGWVLDDSLSSQMLLLTFAMVAEIEHALISARTK
jgi:DNA invertase Pin-like site-specific DNA recombinase